MGLNTGDWRYIDAHHHGTAAATTKAMVKELQMVFQVNSAVYSEGNRVREVEAPMYSSAQRAEHAHSSC